MVVEVGVKYYMGDDAFKWSELAPGDSIVVPSRIVLEAATDNAEVRHGDVRVLVIGLTRHQTHMGLTMLTVWVLGRFGVAYFTRNLDGKPSRSDRRRWSD